MPQNTEINKNMNTRLNKMTMNINDINPNQKSNSTPNPNPYINPYQNQNQNRRPNLPFDPKIQFRGFKNNGTNSC